MAIFLHLIDELIKKLFKYNDFYITNFLPIFYRRIVHSKVILIINFVFY